MTQCIEYVIYLSKAINQSKRLHANGSVELCEGCLSLLISADYYPVSISILAFVCPGPSVKTAVIASPVFLWSDL